ncbi:MAG TPA: carbohydrate kinase [Gammaproteobacteria bacterium]|nr:carbohydrate kinase [Gammaproteobacteria bacterium]
MPTALYLGLDLGTSGCRGVLIDGHGRLSTSAAAPLTAQTPKQWWHAVCTVLDQLASRADLRQVRRLAVDGTSGTVLLTDDHGRPASPALLYNDTRASTEAERIAAVAPLESAARGGASSLAKLLWLRERADSTARHALHQAEWIAGRLCGRWGWGDENNCLKMGYDPVGRCWPGWLDALQVPRNWLPQVLPAGATGASLAPAIARRFGFAPEATVAAGTTDGVASFLAAGAHRVGDAVTALGSTLVIKILAERPLSAPRYGVYSHRLGDRWLAGGASNSGGAVLLQHFHQTELTALTPALRPDQPTGLDYYPLPAPGERFPVSDPHLAPRLAPRPTDRAVFLQGLLEGVAQIEKQGYQRLAALGAPWPRRVLTVGGGARNPAWARIRARVLGMPVDRAAHSEAAYGTARLAAGLGIG